MAHDILRYPPPSHYILELICNEPAEFNLRLDHGLNEDVREWLTGPVNVL